MVSSGRENPTATAGRWATMEKLLLEVAALVRSASAPAAASAPKRSEVKKEYVTLRQVSHEVLLGDDKMPAEMWVTVCSWKFGLSLGARRSAVP
eukprot:1628258-Amphidinium_carterae.2